MDNYESVKNYETYGINKVGKIKDYRTGKIMKTHFNFDGYEKVNLRNPNGVKPFLVHRLVGIQFLEIIEGKDEIDHIDRDIKNNNIENLRWADRYEQVENRGDFKNNKLNLKYISYEKNKPYHSHRYRIQITKNKVKVLNKSFGCNSNKLEDVIKFRDEFLKTL